MFASLHSSMFKTLSKSTIGPTEEQLKFGEYLSDKPKSIELVNYQVKVYRFNSPEDIALYCEDMRTLIDGVARRTHIIFNQDRQFIASDSTWVVYLEWGEFAMSENELED